MCKDKNKYEGFITPTMAFVTFSEIAHKKEILRKKELYIGKEKI
jgi:hypothetical protein